MRQRHANATIGTQIANRVKKCRKLTETGLIQPNAPFMEQDH
jgi:hypothetical protein